MEEKKISRRKFLKGATAGTVGVAAASVLGVSAFAEPDAATGASTVLAVDTEEKVVRVLEVRALQKSRIPSIRPAHGG